MATMIDSLITCPYDETHRIARESLPIHLVKCGRNHTSSTKLICPFDVTHVVDDSYYERHLCNCASSGNVRNYKYSLESERRIGVVSWEVVTKASVPLMKDWQETEVESYDPWKSTENRDVIRYLFVASKSKKREFRLAERRRLQALECRKFAIDFPKKSESFQTIHKSSKKHFQDVLSDFVKKMKKLSVNDVDLILETIDIGKLRISEPKINLKERKGEIIEKVLVKALQNMVLNSSKHEIL